MKIYRVGGFVRDQLLGREPKDADYVVVGATAQEMLSLGYKKVGAEFPVFLKDGNEYALARTERKTGVGYNGFITDFNPNVTLEDDLLRRDLTINAMAQDLETGEIIDPFNGKKDLENGIIRHVSEAFAEDPLRVLRAARFQARYGFKLAEETVQLMIKLVKANEMEALTTERVWLELEKGLMEKDPVLFITSLQHCGAWKRLFPEMENLWYFDTVLNKAAKRNLSFEQRVMILSVFMREEQFEHLFARIKAPTHIYDLSKILREMITFLTYGKQSTTVEKFLEMFKKLDVIRRPQRLLPLNEVFEVFSHNDEKMKLWDTFKQAVAVCVKINTSSFDITNLTGPQIGEKIDVLRKEAISKQLIEHYKVEEHV